MLCQYGCNVRNRKLQVITCLKCLECHCQTKPGRGHGSRSADSFQIPTTVYLSDMIKKYSLFNPLGFFSCDFDHPPWFWLICIRVLYYINLCRLFLLPPSSFLCIFYLFRLFEIRSNCIHVMNDSGFFLCLWWASKLPSRVTLSDSTVSLEAIFKLHFLKTAQIKFQIKLVLAQSMYNCLMFGKF